MAHAFLNDFGCIATIPAENAAFELPKCLPPEPSAENRTVPIAHLKHNYLWHLIANAGVWPTVGLYASKIARVCGVVPCSGGHCYYLSARLYA